MSYHNFKFNTTLRDKESNFITMPPMIKFCAENKIRHTSIYGDTIDAIQKFARLSDKNYTLVLDWGEKIIKEGIKQLYVISIFLEEPMSSIVKNIDNCKKYIEELFPECENSYLLSCNITPKNLLLQSIEYIESDEADSIEMISFYFTIRLLDGEIAETGTPFIYPVFVDLDLNKKLIIARSKPKSKMYTCNEADDIVLESNKVDIKKIIDQAIDYINKRIPFKLSDKKAMTSYYKNAIYNFLETLTFTPECIKNEIEDYNDNIEDFINNFFEDKNISNEYFDKAKEDIEIFVEKYLSISVPEESENIFEDDREGYPIDIATTDHEKCKMRESSSDKSPLQTKELYFDNKKSLKRQKACDTVRLYYNRIDKKYYGSEPFFLVLDVDSGFLRISFRQYVEEEDIQNVLCKILELGEV
ncbi:MAG: hypothetical protein AB9836_07470 [Aminipila sp.]